MSIGLNSVIYEFMGNNITAEALFLGLFYVVNLWRLAIYIPQIVMLYKLKERPNSTSTITFICWGLTSIITAIYMYVFLNDIANTLINIANAFFNLSVFIMAKWKMKQYKYTFKEELLLLVETKGNSITYNDLTTFIESKEVKKQITENRQENLAYMELQKKTEKIYN